MQYELIGEGYGGYPYVLLSWRTKTTLTAPFVEKGACGKTNGFIRN